jgi:hypothetical protein
MPHTTTLSSLLFVCVPQVVTAPSSLYFEQGLNCLRVLTRLLPFLLEVPNDPFVHELCWVRAPPPRSDDAKQVSHTLTLHTHSTHYAIQSLLEVPHDPFVHELCWVRAPPPRSDDAKQVSQTFTLQFTIKFNLLEPTFNPSSFIPIPQFIIRSICQSHSASSSHPCPTLDVSF